MKACKIGLGHIWIDFHTGSVRMCGWANWRIGNLTEKGIEELWHGEKAEEFRKSLQDGSYKYCDHKECPFLANDKMAEVMVEYKVPEYPTGCSFSYERQCNYVCKFCRHEKYIPVKTEKDDITRIENEIKKFSLNLIDVKANGVGELFCSPSTMKLLAETNWRKEAKITLESNGSLFNEYNWKKISKLGGYDLSVAITVHSFNNDTYQFLSGTNLPVSNVMNNLKFIQSLREKEIINRFEIATVVCERNFRELPEYVKTALTFNPDTIRLRFFMPYGVRPLAIEWFFDIRNPKHPYHEEFEKIMKDPILQHPKVWKWQGDAKSHCDEHPFVYEHKRGLMLTKLIEMSDVKRKAERYFQKHHISSVALYGKTYMTGALLNFFSNDVVKIEKILETRSNGGELCGISVEQAKKENLTSDAIVIIAIAYIKEITETLRTYGYQGKIINVIDMVDELATSDCEE